jgi:N-acetylneuraminic acid mutarotase
MKQSTIGATFFFSILVLHPYCSHPLTEGRGISNNEENKINHKTWTKLDSWTSNTPEGRSEGAASPVHIIGQDGRMSDSVVLFGGRLESDPDGAYPPSNTTWIYNPSTNSWRSLLSFTRKPLVYGHTMVTMCNETIFLFGGVVKDNLLGVSVTNDTWSFEAKAESWSEIEVEIQDDIIEPRAYHSAVSVYQELSHSNCACKESMLVFSGGHILTSTLLYMYNNYSLSYLYDDFWELRCVETGYHWFRLTPDVEGSAKPSKRYSPAATSIKEVMYMFGGCDIGGYFGCEPKTDLWSYNASSNRWRELKSEPFPSQGLHRLVYMDRSSYRNSSRIKGLFLCCTKPFYFFDITSQQWRKLDFLGTDEEDYKDLVNAIVTEVGGDIYVFGGFDYPSLIVQDELWKITMLETDTCLLTKKSQDPFPPVRGVQVAVLDRKSDSIIAHGGLSYVTMYFGADYSERNTGVWLFDMNKRIWSVRRPSEQLSLIGHVGALLSYPDRVLVVFGGFSSGDYQVTPNNSTWGFFVDENIWFRYETTGNHPESRRASSAIAINSRSIIIFGGVKHSGEVLNDTWMFTSTNDKNVGQWTEIVSQGSPRRFGHTLVLVDNAQILVYGGSMRKQTNSSGNVACSDELWSFDLIQQLWQRIVYHSNGPGPRCFHSAAGSGKKMIVAGGCYWQKNTAINGRFYLYDIQIDSCLNGEDVPRVWYYSVETKIWTEIDSLPFINSDFIKGKLLLLGEQNIVAFGGYSTPPKPTNEHKNKKVWQAAGVWSITAGCPAGTEAQNFWNNACDPCPPGHFSDFNARQCTKCPVGLTTPKVHATTKRNCSLCDPKQDVCDQGVCYVPKDSIDRDIFDRKCHCNDGYTLDQSGKCTVPTAYLASIGAFAVSVIVCCALILYIRYTRAKRVERRQQQMELAAMNQVWRIKASEILMKERIDGDCPGGFGEVYKAEYRELTVAVKKLHSMHTEIGRCQQEFDREMQVMRTIRHPNIVLFFGGGYFESDEGGSRSPFLVVEYMPRGCLGSVLRDKSMPLDDKHKLNFALDTAEGMAFLHSLRPPRIHRDLKSYNLLVSDRWTVKVADFGAARLVKQEGMCQAASRNKEAVMTTPLLKEDALLSTDCGSLLWCAPELLECRDYGTPVDVYSFGIVLWEIWERRLPYDDHDSGFSYQIETLVCQGTRPTIPKHNEWPSDVISLMCTCWCHHPHKRPTFDSVVEKLKEMKDNL